MNKVLRVFFDVDMRCSHPGLSKLAKELADVDLYQLKPLQHVVFFNKAMTRIKVFSSGAVLSYVFRHNGVSAETIQFFSEAFGAEGFAYDKALKKMIMEKVKI